MTKRKRPVTWLDVAAHYAGFRKAVTALVWAYQWAVVREKLNREPTVEEVAEWWGMNRRTAFRDQATFRKAFPMLETPAQIYASPEVRESLKKHADFGDKLDQKLGKTRNLPDEETTRSTDLGALAIGMLPANL